MSSTTLPKTPKTPKNPSATKRKAKNDDKTLEPKLKKAKNNKPPKIPIPHMSASTSVPQSESVPNSHRSIPDGVSATVDLDKLLEQDSKKYSKKELKEHILTLPDTYIGSTVPSEIETWVVNDNLSDNNTEEQVDVISTPLIVQKKVTVSMGLYKIIDEILQNAADNVPRTKAHKMTDPSIDLTTQLKISFEDDGHITVWNNGEGIPIVEHKEHKVLIPTMIFGELLTSGNYGDQEQRRWGGKNGYGSKISSIFSKEFVVETVDRVRQKKFVQKWTENMSVITPAKVTDFTGASYTKITFLPDYKRFGCQNLTHDMKSLLYRRVYDLAGTTGVSVFLNKKKLAIRHFQHFTELFLDKSVKRVYECVYEPKDPTQMAWEIVACPSPDGTFQHVSYVNFVSTFQGGKHVDYIADRISKKLCDQFNEKLAKNQTPIQRKHIKNNLWIFVNASIVNPSFSSQTKEYLTTTAANYSPCELTDGFYQKLMKSEIMDRARLLKDFQEQKMSVKTDGKKVKTIFGIPKLEDANEAGGKKSRQCTLILTEGDSAKTFAVSGLGVVGRDYYGVFPLKGKVLNVRDASVKEVLENQEIQNLKKILGLREGLKSIDDLRYGEVMILTDEDVDGIHIKGLLMNLFDVFWQDIIKQGFLISMYTPLVKVQKGTKTVAIFYNEREFLQWKESHPTHSMSIRYYKGLGTHTANEAREYFKSMQKIKYIYDDKSPDMLRKVFDEKMADQRKEWIAQHHHVPLDYTLKKIDISEFVDKALITYSNANNIRSIPSFMDGFKPSQRKVICGVLRRNQVKEIKVSQLVGPISSEMAYHHGEKSLEMTVINMAQNFVGSNNINLLHPQGQFGTRLLGGQDAASSRYIFTHLEPITRKIFRPEDDAILRSNVEDDKKVEPQFYLPVIPMILVNGASGIGTGFSTDIPNFNPMDIIQNIRKILHNEPLNRNVVPYVPFLPLIPWYRKFQGEIVKRGEQYISKGKWSKITNSTIHITELPLNSWTDTYKAYLEKLVQGEVKKAKGGIVKYKINNKQDERFIDITVELDKDYSDEDIEAFLKLTENKTCNINNMHMFSPGGNLVKFKTPEDILSTFCQYRLHFYDQRRSYQLQLLDRDITELKEKMRFIRAVIDKTLVLMDCEKSKVYQQLQKLQFLPNPHLKPIVIPPTDPHLWNQVSEPHVVLSALYSRKETGISSNNINNTENNHDDDINNNDTEDINDIKDIEVKGTAFDQKSDYSKEVLMAHYKYLVSIPVYNFTREEIKRLEKQLEDKQKQFQQLEQSSNRVLWLHDLEELEKELVKHNKLNE